MATEKTLTTKSLVEDAVAACFYALYVEDVDGISDISTFTSEFASEKLLEVAIQKSRWKTAAPYDFTNRMFQVLSDSCHGNI